MLSCKGKGVFDVVWVVSSVRKCIRGVSYIGKGLPKERWDISSPRKGSILVFVLLSLTDDWNRKK